MRYVLYHSGGMRNDHQRDDALTEKCLAYLVAFAALAGASTASKSCDTSRLILTIIRCTSTDDCPRRGTPSGCSVASVDKMTRASLCIPQFSSVDAALYMMNAETASIKASWGFCGGRERFCSIGMAMIVRNRAVSAVNDPSAVADPGNLRAVRLLRRQSS